VSDAGYSPMPPTQAFSLPGNEVVHLLDPPAHSSRPTVRLAYPPEYREYPRAPSTYLESPTFDFHQHHTQEHPRSLAGPTTTRADPPMDSPPPVATSSAVALYDGEPGEQIDIGSLVQSFSYLANGRGEPAIPATPPLYSSIRQLTPLYPTSHMNTLLSAPHPTSESPRTPSSPPLMIGEYYTTTSTATLVNGEPAGEAYRDSLAQPSHHPREDPYAAAHASTLPPQASASSRPSTTRPTQNRRQRRT
ncbi:uncharacterized protein SCHCODRAFT_02475466, partial [Schizophyllum commune H4-8]|uniref:uncharacterized protein n=1 Tax=Schizophyllum commune (strain H4-8 / FGSC 9210) TaxID=578458 RepID=UPI00215F1702